MIRVDSKFVKFIELLANGRVRFVYHSGEIIII